MIKHYALTNLGKARANNEDYFLAHHDLNLYLLADGIGGHNYGEVAAKLACDVISDTFIQVLKLAPLQDLDTAQALVKFAIHKANRAILQKSLNDPVYKGMGTTIVVCFKYQNHLIIAHLGDSRCYQLHTHLEQLTQDHTRFLSASPKSSSFRTKHYLTKSLGLKEFIEPSLTIHDFNPQALYLLCSDGLSDYVEKNKIEEILKVQAPLETKSIRLLEAALATKAKDNLTFILIGKDLS